MSRTRRLGVAAYRRMIQAAPSVLVDGADDQLSRFTGRRAHTLDQRAAVDWAQQIKVPSKWYATDSTGGFYYFRRKRTDFLPGWNCFGRLPTTAFGGNAAQAFLRHGGQLTDRKPPSFLSAATISAINFGGLDGGPRDWGWQDNEDLDLSIAVVEHHRAKDPGPFHRGHLSEFAEGFGRALAGAR